MRNFKRILVLLVLVFAGAVCLTSCSCSGKKNTEDPSTDPGTTPVVPLEVTYTISVEISGNVGGTYSSTPSGNVHLENTSPVYTFTPEVGFAVETILLDGGVYFTHEASGYSQTPVNITFPNIDKNHNIVVTFHQMDFFVVAEIDNSGYAVRGGGEVLSSTGSNQHKGGTSPVYTIKPKDGFCIYSISLDGEGVYSYLDNPAISTNDFVLDTAFSEIASNHEIKVSFYELFDSSVNLVDSYYYTANNFLPETMDDEGLGSVENSISSATRVVANGMPEVVTLSATEHFTLSEIAVSLDGVSFTEKFSATEDFEGTGFRYVASDGKIYFENFTSVLKIQTYVTPRQVQMIVYNYDTKEALRVDSKSLYSYYVITEALKDCYWYYSLSTNYTEENVYHETDVSTTVLGGETLYHLYLDGNMLAEKFDGIILIYSTNDLIN